MTYTAKVIFNKTNLYSCGPGADDDVYTIKEVKHLCNCGVFIDYDGYGYPVKAKLANENIEIQPSKLHTIPKDATHIVWYNK